MQLLSKLTRQCQECLLRAGLKFSVQSLLFMEIESSFQQTQYVNWSLPYEKHERTIVYTILSFISTRLSVREQALKTLFFHET